MMEADIITCRYPLDPLEATTAASPQGASRTADKPLEAGGERRGHTVVEARGEEKEEGGRREALGVGAARGEGGREMGGAKESARANESDLVDEMLVRHKGLGSSCSMVPSLQVLAPSLEMGLVRNT
jgi:hypothetical protein